jgi:hypothetical protein
MFVVDTTLSSGTRVTKESSLQRLVFPLPPDLQRKVRKNQRKWMGKEAAALAPLPWDRDGLVTFTYSTSSQRSQPLFCDRRDEPLPGRSRQQIHTGQPVRLSLRQVQRGGTRPGTRLEVLKVQLLLIDAPAGKNRPASPHSIQTVPLALPVDLMQEVERLAKAGDWSVSAWLRNAIESQVSRAQRERDNRRSAA